MKARKGCNINFHYAIGPFVIMSRLDLPIVDQIIESLNFQEAQKIIFYPKKTISNRKKIKRCGTFEYDEVKGLEALENAKAIINVEYIEDERNR